MTSNWSQFLLLSKWVIPTSRISEPGLGRELATFEMVIPVAADSELVAVRALEQMADNLNFDDKTKGQVRMALMEACINAKEYAAAPGGKIHLRFQGMSAALLIHLRVETLAPKKELRAKPVVEVWNLSLLRTLMDEARISHGPSGLELSMTKYLSNALPQVG